MSKKYDDDIMSTNCNVIVIFPIYGQFGAIRKPDSERKVCKIYIFIVFFCKKNANISKIKEVLVLKGIFSETTYVCILTYQISSF